MQERTAIFDIETNGLLLMLNKVHSLVIKIVETGEVISCADQPGYFPIENGLKILERADRVVGHNILKFDLPALKKVYPDFDVPFERVYDTLIYSRLIWPDAQDRDARAVRRRRYGMPAKMWGSHGLEAWGYRLGLHKGDYAKEMKAKGLDPWAEWNPDMQEYCENDVEVTDLLWERIQERDHPTRALRLEHKFAYIIAKQEAFGYRFNVEKAVALYAELSEERQKLDEEIKAYFPDWYINKGLFKPKRSNRRTGYVEGVPLCKVVLQEFNPASRAQIADRLTKLYGWKPKEFTESGQPKVDETILGKLPYPPAKFLARRFLIEKRIGQIAEGKQAWLKLERNGRIHGDVNTIGAVTGRCTHSNPNVAQVPSTGAEYGQQCRELFHVDPGYKQVGCDAAGLELRCLAHYMSRWDGGKYGEIILNGDKSKGTDIHTINQKAAGLPTRDNAKTFIYGFLYGAGDAKLGSIVGKGPEVGKKLKEDFLNKTPALKYLREAVSHKVEKYNYLIGIDGRKLYIRHEHAALNTLLQSAGALLVKQATINLYEELSARGYEWGKDWAMVAHVHDEYQLQVREELVDEIAEVAVWSFQEAGRQFDWRCPLDGDVQVGDNWAECH